MEKSDSIKELGTALAKAQSELKPLLKNSKNPFFKSNYADLSESVEKIIPVLARHGLSVAQGGAVSKGEGKWVIETLLIHSSGEWLSFVWPVIISKENPGPQDFASSSSYARRYALQAIASAAAEEDDDANKAQGHNVGLDRQPVPQITPAQKPLINHAPVWPPPDLQDELPPVRSDGPGDFMITFGKHTGKTIAQVGFTECHNYSTWLKGSAEKSGKPLSDKVKEFCDLVESLK